MREIIHTLKTWLNCHDLIVSLLARMTIHRSLLTGIRRGADHHLRLAKTSTQHHLLFFFFFLIRCWGKRQNQMIIRIGVHLAPKSNIVWPAVLLFFFLSRIYSENCTTILVYTLYQHCYIGKWILWCNNNKSLISEISKVPIMNIFVCHQVQM